MRPGKHAASGIALGSVIYTVIGQKKLAMTAAAAAVVCDLDHVLEYMVFCKNEKVKPVVQQFFSGSYFDNKEHIFIVFHAYEYLIFLVTVFAIAIRKKWTAASYIGAAAAGYGMHLILDTIGNDCTFKGYFITYRMKKEWNIRKICESKD